MVKLVLFEFPHEFVTVHVQEPAVSPVAVAVPSPASGTQTLKDFSPQTLDERFYVYNTALNAYSNYQSASGIFGGMPDEVTFVTAKGYLIRMPDGTSETTPTVFNGSFVGTPNNGDISIALNTQGNRYNAVGNPYPSSVVNE